MATKNKNYAVIDVRPPQQFTGKTSFTNKRGHIPQGINIPWYKALKNRENKDNYLITEKIAK